MIQAVQVSAMVDSDGEMDFQGNPLSLQDESGDDEEAVVVSGSGEIYTDVVQAEKIHEANSMMQAMHVALVDSNGEMVFQGEPLSLEDESDDEKAVVSGSGEIGADVVQMEEIYEGEAASHLQATVVFTTDEKVHQGRAGLDVSSLDVSSEAAISSTATRGNQSESNQSESSAMMQSMVFTADGRVEHPQKKTYRGVDITAKGVEMTTLMQLVDLGDVQHTPPEEGAEIAAADSERVSSLQTNVALNSDGQVNVRYGIDLILHDESELISQILDRPSQLSSQDPSETERVSSLQTNVALTNDGVVNLTYGINLTLYDEHDLINQMYDLAQSNAETEQQTLVSLMQTTHAVVSVTADGELLDDTDHPILPLDDEESNRYPLESNATEVEVFHGDAATSFLQVVSVDSDGEAHRDAHHLLIDDGSDGSDTAVVISANGESILDDVGVEATDK